MASGGPGAPRPHQRAHGFAVRVRLPGMAPGAGAWDAGRLVRVAPGPPSFESMSCNGTWTPYAWPKNVL